MRKMFSMVMVVAFVLALVSPLFAATQTVKGEVIDVVCHMKKGDGGHGEAHADCAMMCAKKGAAMGILAEDGVYAIAGDFAKDKNAKLLDYVAKMVEATGDVTEQDGKKVINVTAIKAAK